MRAVEQPLCLIILKLSLFQNSLYHRQQIALTQQVIDSSRAQMHQLQCHSDHF
jgi:hypothetical protein